MYDIVSPGSGQAHIVAGLFQLMGSQTSSLHSKRPHTVTKMHENICMNSIITVSMATFYSEPLTNKGVFHWDNMLYIWLESRHIKYQNVYIYIYIRTFKLFKKSDFNIDKMIFKMIHTFHRYILTIYLLMNYCQFQLLKLKFVSILHMQLCPILSILFRPFGFLIFRLWADMKVVPEKRDVHFTTKFDIYHFL